MNTNIIMVNGIEYVPKVVVPEPVKVSRWKPETGDIFWYVSSDGRYAFRESYSNNNNSNEHMCLYGNMYQTQELATRARDKQLLLVELQDYADQKNAGEEMTEQCYSLAKFGDNWGWVDSICIIPGTVQFRDEDDAEFAIEHFGSRLDLLLIK